MLSTATFTGDFNLAASDASTIPCGATLAGGASCEIFVQFAPRTAGSASGQLILATSAGNATATLLGNGTTDPGVAISPLALTFAGSAGAASQTVAVTNTGQAAVSVGAPSVTSANFTATTNCGTLVPAASCSVSVAFQPGAHPANGTLSIPVSAAGGSAANPPVFYSVGLAGLFSAASSGFVAAPGTTTFGPAATGSIGPARLISITNSTANSVTLSVYVPQSFVLQQPVCATLAAGASCTLAVQFAPLTNGDVTSALVVSAIPSDGSATLSATAYLEGYGTGSSAMILTGG